MTEDQIERWAEAHMNGLDSALMSWRITQADYDRRVRVLDATVRLKLHGLKAEPIAGIEAGATSDREYDWRNG
jgi:hypothetical protein